ncbi:hypothetical protein BaOVIS_009410 [Babesia ovis]|uniref:SF-assemblin n=1 Tax=Babesia ovis TaxID=5869 RepID=A0A9W5TBR0_BABOV|nr:hypothetical protein BaOVIS_009410 [Babesia ovis]
MGLHDELEDMTISIGDSGWKRPFGGWSNVRATEPPRTNGASIESFSGANSLKSYLSQIKLGMENGDIDSDGQHQDQISSATTTILSGDFQNKVPSKYDRVKKLESSLYGIQSNVESKRSNILEEIYQKINALETKISESENQERRSYNETSKKIDVIQRSISTAQAKHTSEIKEAISKMEDVYQRYNEQIRAEKELWKKQEKDAISEVMKNIDTIRTELEEMKKSKTHVATYLKKYIDVELPQLKTRISAASEEIASMEKTITENTNDDLVMLASFIKQESSQLHEIKRTVLMEVARNAESAKAQIAKESEERKDMQQRIVDLMEETLKRLGSPL